MVLLRLSLPALVLAILQTCATYIHAADNQKQQLPLWKCFPDYQTCKEACMQATGDRVSGWCPGICAENGTGNRPKPREFGSQRCFQPEIIERVR